MRLTPYDDGLLGESIDPHLGGITFSHTDVSLPGNSSLDVSVRRKISQDALYHESVQAEFGDWELMVPRITVTVHKDSNYRTGNRCSRSSGVNFQSVQVWYRIRREGQSDYSRTSKQVHAHEYSNGMKLDVPGSGTMNILNGFGTAQAGAGYAFGNAEYVTKENFKIDCISNITGGGEGFLATGPDGTTYKFGRFFEHRAKDLQFSASNEESFQRYVSIVSATEVEDVHGNKVNYTYNGANQVTKIQSTDGRRIDIAYSGEGGKISSVTANGRQWTYDYGVNDAQLTYWENDVFPVGNYPTLEKVTQPDGKFWDIDFDAMGVGSPPGQNCHYAAWAATITHPYGTRGVFSLENILHRPSEDVTAYRARNSEPGSCPKPDESAETTSNFNPQIDQSEYLILMHTISMINKTITGPGLPSGMSWDYHYENDRGPNQNIPGTTSNVVPNTNFTEVTRPDGTIEKYYHRWGTELVDGNQLIKSEVINDGTVLKTTDHTNIWANAVGGRIASGGLLDFFADRPRYITQRRVEQDGDWYETNMSYQTNVSSSAYSFGLATETSTKSNVSTTPRTTQRVYEHRKPTWLIGLLKQTKFKDGGSFVTVNDYAYNSDGMVTQTKNFGVNEINIDYNPDGTINSVTDGLGRIAQASNWYRGKPQMIRRAVGEEEEVTQSRVYDANGWPTSSTDGKGNTTAYTYDNMGRVTLINPPGNYFVSTSIAYDFSGAKPKQTVIQGSSRTIVTYDAMFRPTQEYLTDLIYGTSTSGQHWRSYTNTTYDNMGRVIFKSQPSAASNVSTGTDFTYDALGRQTLSRENFGSNVETSTAYLSQHRTQVTDAEGNITTTKKDGFGDVLQILQPEGVTTTIARNNWGEMTSVSQGGKTQTYAYDAKHRLCGQFAEETGAARYAYDIMGQMIASSKGHSSLSTSCGAPAGAFKFTQGYDALGRPKTTNYVDSNTPDIQRDYDDNSQLTSLNRMAPGPVQQSYAYDVIGNLEQEITAFDGLNFVQDHTYRNDSALIQSDRAYFHNMWSSANRYEHTITYGRDGLGAAKGVSLDGQVLANNARFHPNRSMSQLDYGNGAIFSQSLNPRLLPKIVETMGPAGLMYGNDYSYDDNGRVIGSLSSVSSRHNRSYTYDGLGRLSTAQGPWNIASNPNSPQASASFGYDTLGNITARTLGSRNFGYTYNTKKQLTQHTDNQEPTRNLSYDSRGNVTTLGSQQFVYDAADRPRSISGPVDGTYRYDGHGRRVKSQINEDGQPNETLYNVYDVSGSLIWVVREGGASVFDKHVSHYVQMDGKNLVRVKSEGTNVSHTDTITWLHNDHLGTANVGADANGVIQWRDTYSPFGISLTPNVENNDVAGFTGHIRDSALDLNYMQARYYDPKIGRFLSGDPATILEMRDSRYFNRYAYVGNDPVSFTDPSGEQIFEDNRMHVTVTAGASATGAQPLTSSGGGLAGSAVGTMHLSFGLPGSSGTPLIPRLGPLSPTVQPEGAGTAVSGTDQVVGAIADLDLIEGGLHLGQPSDLEGGATNIEGDAGAVGIELSVPDEGVAGVGIRLSLGPGFGAAISHTETSVNDVNEADLADSAEEFLMPPTTVE